MPYTPMNKFLTATEDIRIQHRYSTIATNLSRSTNFNKKEILRLIQLYYMFTTKQNRIMDKFCFIQFMDIFLGFRNIDAVEKIYLLRSRTNKKYLTAEEFIELLSLLLKGSLADTIKFCFVVYLELVRSSPYIQKDDVLMMARKSSLKMCKLINMEEYNQNFVEFIMNVIDKDRDNRISLEDYRTAVHEDNSRLQFLGPILPTPDNIETFMKLFTTRPYINNLEMTAMLQITNNSNIIIEKKQKIENSRKLSKTNNPTDITKSLSNSTQISSMSDDSLNNENDAAKNPISDPKEYSLI